MLLIKQIAKSILSIRRHYIMKLLLPPKNNQLNNNKYNLLLIKDESDLIDGTYTVSLQKRLINKNLGYCETYICK